MIVRRSTRTIVSKGQKMKVSPGPFGMGASRPSQKVTARSYSLRMLTHLKRKKIATNRTARKRGPVDGEGGISVLAPMLRFDEESQPFDREDLD